MLNFITSPVARGPFAKSRTRRRMSRNHNPTTQRVTRPSRRGANRRPTRQKGPDERRGRRKNRFEKRHQSKLYWPRRGSGSKRTRCIPPRRRQAIRKPQHKGVDRAESKAKRMPDFRGKRENRLKGRGPARGCGRASGHPIRGRDRAGSS